MVLLARCRWTVSEANMETAPRSFDPETHGGRDSLWRDVEKGDKALATDAMVTLFFWQF